MVAPTLVIDDAEVDHHVRRGAAALVALRHDLHRHPELSNRESRTAAVIERELRACGLDEVRTGIAGHGVIGVLRGGRPGPRTVALRADMDALPVREVGPVGFASTVVDPAYPGGPFPVAHACGHDCHMATVVAAARALAAMRDRVPGTVLFVFQPAEEGPPVDEVGGARAMVDAGAFDDPTPTMVFGMHVSTHPRGTVAYRPGRQFAASSLVRIVVEGRGAHASQPWAGIDPLPAAAAMITASAQLHRQVPAFDPVSVTIGHIEDTGRFNVIGGSVTLWGTLRALADARLADLGARLVRTVDGIAAAHGCTARTDLLQPVPAVDNRPAWLDPGLVTLRRVVGEPHLVQTGPTLVYDDVSELTGAFGGLYLQYGVQDTEWRDGELVATADGRGLVPNHHPAFYADDACLVDSVRVHVHVALDHLRGALDAGGAR